MVSFHTPLSPNRRKIMPELENLLKRRRLDDGDDDDDDRRSSAQMNILRYNQNPIKAAGQSMMTTMMMKSSPLDTELHLETPIPQEWQRCLDIKSGQIYFYNTRTNKRMLSDPRSSPEPTSPPPPPPPPPPPSSHGHSHMSLDLELNLPCGSSSSAKDQVADDIKKANNSSSNQNSSPDHHPRQLIIPNTTATAAANNHHHNNRGTGLSRAPSWLSFEGEQEMVAAACKKCHMLVMMCKSSPSCPNCKFLHPPEQSTTPGLLKRRLSLLC